VVGGVLQKVALVLTPKLLMVLGLQPVELTYKSLSLSNRLEFNSVSTSHPKAVSVFNYKLQL
jgi:hypothetical protein